MVRVSEGRLTRAQQQERTRAAVLTAARDEFAEHGYGEATVDRIADRADLTRGAVYSNFPSKRALYLAVLVDQVERTEAGAEEAADARPSTVAGALEAFARAWLDRLPLAGDPPAGGRLRLRSLTGAIEDGEVVAELARLEALLLGLALESFPSRRRRVRLADVVLTLLAGAAQRAETAPGSGDPFDVAGACAHLAGLDLADDDPPHLPYVGAAKGARDAWAPPPATDLVTGGRADLEADGVVAILGARRLGAAEEAVRAAHSKDRVSLVVVTNDRAETGRLVRLRVGDLVGCLRRSLPARAWPRCQLILDEDGSVAAAAGVPEPGDATEVAVRISGAQVSARAHGRGAGHAAGSAR
jgi:AcrR family transcriptional regulator